MRHTGQVTRAIALGICNPPYSFNDNELAILVLVDDDEDGKRYKDDILKIKGVFTNNNVFTLRDLVEDIVENGTIEDCLGKGFIQSKFSIEFKNNVGVVSR